MMAPAITAPHEIRRRPACGPVTSVAPEGYVAARIVSAMITSPHCYFTAGRDHTSSGPCWTARTPHDQDRSSCIQAASAFRWHGICSYDAVAWAIGRIDPLLPCASNPARAARSGQRRVSSSEQGPLVPAWACPMRTRPRPGSSIPSTAGHDSIHGPAHPTYGHPNLASRRRHRLVPLPASSDPDQRGNRPGGCHR
jgi:hypothetical protein